MQTFLPFDDYTRSASALDDKRLFNQVNECLAITKAIVLEHGWVYHPATHMWKGYLPSMLDYAYACVEELEMRGRPENWGALNEMTRLANLITGQHSDTPPWLGDLAFHASHRSNLKRKDSRCYHMFDVPDDLEYVWPHWLDDSHATYELRLAQTGEYRVKSGKMRDPRKLDWS